MYTPRRPALVGCPAIRYHYDKRLPRTVAATPSVPVITTDCDFYPSELDCPSCPCHTQTARERETEAPRTQCGDRHDRHTGSDESGPTEVGRDFAHATYPSPLAESCLVKEQQDTTHHNTEQCRAGQGIAVQRRAACSSSTSTRATTCRASPEEAHPRHRILARGGGPTRHRHRYTGENTAVVLRVARTRPARDRPHPERPPLPCPRQQQR